MLLKFGLFPFFLYICPINYITYYNMSQPNNQEVQIDISPEVEDGVYSNLAVITHSSAEFVLDFLRLVPGKNKPKVAARVVMAPEHAKRVLLALRDNIVKYEAAFGNIDLHETASRTIAPFKVPKGEA